MAIALWRTAALLCRPGLGKAGPLAQRSLIVAVRRAVVSAYVACQEEIFKEGVNGVDIADV